MRAHSFFILLGVLALRPGNVAADASSPAFSQPLTLADCLRLAENNPPTAELLRARVTAALGIARQAAAWPNPTFTYLAQDIGLTAADRPVLLHQQMLSYPLFFAFTRNLEAAAAHAQSRRVATEAKDTLRQLRLTVATAYHDLLLQQELAAIDEQAVRISEQLVAVTTRRQQAGDIAPLDITRAGAEELDARRRHELSVRKLDLDRLALSILLGAEEPRPVQLAKEPTELPKQLLRLLPAQPANLADPPKEVVAQLVELAFTQRPDLRRASAELERAELTQRLERRRSIPLADLQVAVGAREQWIGAGAVVSVSMPLPLLDHNAGGRQRAQAELGAARASLTQSQRQIALGVETALLTWLRAERALVQYVRPLVKLRERAADSAPRLFAEGVVSFLDVTAAQRDHLEARRALAQAERDAGLSRQQLVAAVAAPAP